MPSLPRLPRLLYFLPDWDDFLDVDFDFEHDQFSSRARSTRHEEHSITLMRPQRLCDSVLVSLAQHLGSKGMLKRVGLVTTDASDQSVLNAVGQIDQVVSHIELSALNEHHAGNIPAHWDACGEQQDCDACDFRHFCPSPANHRTTNMVPRPSPVAPG